MCVCVTYILHYKYFFFFLNIILMYCQIPFHLHRFQEERRQLEERLAQEKDSALGQLNQKHQAELEARQAELDTLAAHIEQLKQERQALADKHRAELDFISTDHKAALQALQTELTTRHSAELDKLEAVLQEANEAQLEAKEVELESRHRRAREELETKMLANMDTLENTYLQVPGCDYI